MHTFMESWVVVVVAVVFTKGQIHEKRQFFNKWWWSNSIPHATLTHTMYHTQKSTQNEARI